MLDISRFLSIDYALSCCLVLFLNPKQIAFLELCNILAEIG